VHSHSFVEAYYFGLIDRATRKGMFWKESHRKTNLNKGIISGFEQKASPETRRFGIFGSILNKKERLTEAAGQILLDNRQKNGI
jgi:hypothetical protein